ncbi:MAG: acyltransferase family protein, partial [Holdemanella sp.]|nr:acyltransferase family protein [Holdemanella sp.]
VPFFFVATGFFFFKSLKTKENKKQYLLKYELRMLKLYTVWFCINNSIGILRGNYGSLYSYIRNYIWPMNGSALWFLVACMVAVLLVYVLASKFKPKTIFIISLCVWTVGYCCSTLYPLFQNIPYINSILASIIKGIGVQNGIFFGFPYIAMSYIFASNPIEGSIKRDVIGTAICFIALGVEAILAVKLIHPSLTFLWFFALPMTFFTFHLTLNIDIKNKPIFITMRKMSTAIYCIHPTIINLLKYIFIKYNYSDYMNLTLFILTIILSSLFAIVLVRLSNIKKLNFLKILI